MDQKEISIGSFDLDGFTEVVLGFIRERTSKDAHPSFAILRLDASGCFDGWGPKEGRSNFLEELEAGHTLFFPFTLFGEEDPVRCADGQSLELGEESIVGDMACVGFLFQLKEGILYVDSALLATVVCHTPPSANIQNCDVFDAGMESLIDKFILG